MPTVRGLLFAFVFLGGRGVDDSDTIDGQWKSGKDHHHRPTARLTGYRTWMAVL